ncbi:DEAD/DEAH box helicase domain-containing protein [Ditylenchus destructor]|nr:DEAD/DEAH box helicase domain-containing protein [Ditylenchus destructor]
MTTEDPIDETVSTGSAKEADPHLDVVNEKLNEVMQKRRDNVEKWRQLKKKKEEKFEKEDKPVPLGTFKPIEESNNETSGAAWSLDKEDDEEEDEQPAEPTNGTDKIEDDEEIDPLDAFMAEINKSKGSEGKSKMVIIKSSKESDDASKKKGDIVENDEEKLPKIDDFDITEAVQSSLLAKGKMLPQTDHTKVYYRPFRKNFYVEVPELSRMTKKDVATYREELEELKVRGVDCPKPIKKWAQCGLDLKIMNVLKASNYTKPTPIQAQAIPAIMSGRDVIGIAKTGSGKTLAFLLPMFRHILDQDELDEMDGPIALIMAPTRELALQTWKEANKFSRSYPGIRVVCVYGGVGISEQIADLKKGAEVIVCTPGRMIDMLAANNGRVTNLRRVTYLVMDEADRMFDMGFEPQVMKIVNNIREDRQTVLFSATFPKQMEALARKILVKPVEIQVGGRSVVCADVEQHALIVDESQKFMKLLELLGQHSDYGNVLVFVDKQEKCDDIVSQLMKSGYNCAPLHGGIDQFDRDSTIVDFKTGRLKLMVATSVAARGLDVKKLILVVNYDCPNHYEDYVHRVGRTGRAGNKGWAYTFILPETQAPEELKKMWETFRDEMKAQGIDIHVGGGGFSGSGFKYDADEDESEINKRKMMKLVHGMETGGEDEDEDTDQQLLSMMKSQKSTLDPAKSGFGPAGQSKIFRLVKGKAFRKPDGVSDEKITAARAAAAAIAAAKQLGVKPSVEKDATSLTAEAVMKGHEAAPIQMTAASMAKQKALQLNERLNYLPSQINLLGDGEQQQQYFEEELEINDFPQQLRYRVCSRESIAQVQEFADVGISVKGTHYPPGKEPKNDERKLYLFLEARDEISLRRAKEEIVRIMREQLRQMTASGSRQQYGGRYKLF